MDLALFYHHPRRSPKYITLKKCFIKTTANFFFPFWVLAHSLVSGHFLIAAVPEYSNIMCIKNMMYCNYIKIKCIELVEKFLISFTISVLSTA